jgi:hypothetical protein
MRGCVFICIEWEKKKLQKKNKTKQKNPSLVLNTKTISPAVTQNGTKAALTEFPPVSGMGAEDGMRTGTRITEGTGLVSSCIWYILQLPGPVLLKPSLQRGKN